MVSARRASISVMKRHPSAKAKARTTEQRRPGEHRQARPSRACRRRSAHPTTAVPSRSMRYCTAVATAAKPTPSTTTTA